MLFKYTEENGEYKITHHDGLGDFGVLSRAHDLFFNWWPPAGCGQDGFWSEAMLSEIAAKLDELNKPIWKEYDEYMRKYESEHKDDKLEEWEIDGSNIPV